MTITEKIRPAITSSLLRPDSITLFDSKRGGRQIKTIIFDAEGVLVPISGTLSEGPAMWARRYEFLAKHYPEHFKEPFTEMDEEKRSQVVAFAKGLLKAHHTDSIGYAIQLEKHIPIGRFVEHVFEPSIPKLQKEIEELSDGELKGLVGCTRAELIYQFEHLNADVFALSNTSRRGYVEPAFEGIGIMQFFQGKIIGMEDLAAIGVSKPHKEAYSFALQRYDIDRRRAMFVDDSVANLEAPHTDPEIRMTTLCINRDPVDIEKYQKHSDHIYPTITEAFVAMGRRT
jgi:FMN phosphatase YigB (HAD superfamily)